MLMNKRLILMFALIFFITACNDTTDYNNEDIAVIIRGEEITVGDLRFLYPDDQIEQNLDGVIKSTLVMQEVERLNLDVDQVMQETLDELKSFSVADLNKLSGDNMDKFIKKQANKLKLDEEEYLQEYLKISVKTASSMQVYTENIIGEPGDNDIE